MGKIQAALAAIWKHQKDLGQVISQTEIAKKLGCRQPFVSEMLSGTKGMSADDIEGFCNIFGVTFCELEKWNPELAAKPETRSPSTTFVCDHKKHRQIHIWLEGILTSPRNATNDEIRRGIIANVKHMNRGLELRGTTPEGKHGSRRRTGIEELPLDEPGRRSGGG